jgi:hypothetical protein
MPRAHQRVATIANHVAGNDAPPPPKTKDHLWEQWEMGGTQSWACKEGAYAIECSIAAGEAIDFCVSSSVSRQLVLVFRLDAVRELVYSFEVGGLGLQEVVGERPYADGFGWEPTVTVNTGPEWRSGVYVAQFCTGLGTKEAPFVVRRAAAAGQRCPPILWVLADATWQTYNTTGGKSLYDYQSTGGFGSERLTFDRPHAMDGAGKLVIWDQFWASWLADEGRGIADFDCCTQWDVASGRQPLDRYRCMLRTGHDEYWSAAEAKAVQSFVDRGGNLAFFSGNNVHWQIRYGEGGRSLSE